MGDPDKEKVDKKVKNGPMKKSKKTSKTLLSFGDETWGGVSKRSYISMLLFGSALKIINIELLAIKSSTNTYISRKRIVFFVPSSLTAIAKISPHAVCYWELRGQLSRRQDLQSYEWEPFTGRIKEFQGRKIYIGVQSDVLTPPLSQACQFKVQFYLFLVIIMYIFWGNKNGRSFISWVSYRSTYRSRVYGMHRCVIWINNWYNKW